MTLSEDGVPGDARLMARGGVDTKTGQDFQGLQLSAPWMGLDRPVISPLTTLVDRFYPQDALAVHAVVDEVASLLDLPPSGVMNDPAEDAQVQRASLLLTELWVALRGINDPMVQVAASLRDADGDFAKAAQYLADDAILDLPETIKDRLKGVQSMVLALRSDSVNTAQEVIDAVAQQNIAHGLARFFDKQLGFEPHNQAEKDNLRSLAHAVWLAAGQRGMPANSPGVFNVARYLVQTYPVGIEALEDPEFQLPEGLARDQTIARLAASRVLDHQVPLAEAEVLGMDNQARLEYFLRSDLSPYERAERLFDGVFDDSVLDPVFARIAQGMAAAGLHEEADLVLRAQIFQPIERAEAFRRTGQELFRNGEETRSLEYWDEASGIQQQQLEALGLANLTGADARFYRSLSDDFLAAGYPDRAETIIAPLLDYVNQFGGPGQPWTGNYFNLTTALLNQAEERVKLAAEAGMTGSSYEQAVAATHLLRRWVDDMGSPQPGPTSCRLIQSQYTARYAALYSHLGLREQALAGIDAFEDLMGATCGNQTNAFSRFYVDIIAPAYGAMGLTGRFEQLLEDEVVPYPMYSSAARTAANEIAVFFAVEAAREGGAQAALNEMSERIASPRDRASYLIHRSQGLSTDGRNLAVRLTDEGMLQAAREVADAGWLLSTSAAFIEDSDDFDEESWRDAIGYVPPPGSSPDNARTEVNRLLRNGCHAAALATDELGETTKARQRMAECWSMAQEMYRGASTLLRAEAAWLLANGHLALDMDGDEVVTALRQQARVIDSNDARSQQLRRVADLQSRGGMSEQALATLDDEVMAALQAMAGQVADEASLTTVMRETEAVAKAYLEVALEQRARLHREGHLNGFSQEPVVKAREGAHRVLLGDSSNTAWGWNGYQGLIEELNSPTQQDRGWREGVKLLAAAGKFDLAIAWAETATQDPERWRRLTLIAEALTEWDDFPGTDLARFDFDGDGRPDFFNPQYAESEWMMSPLQMDDDIDGDGIPDTQDLTPYCPGCMDVGSMSRR
ncbi:MULTISPECIES: hypothetical protein [unclassified Ectothiorhodospira]|uniref:hypothetical protein n=1 Tax=unclassified Ectothiorhodospira TaxID=2684909 RepID=UPI001EE90744|nr:MULTISPECIES: hypothetical protein [unclassified Ectothiorhodospira]MCG5517195.1 hypothetical protein [Ectothiorhodospira sp. 9100]MCG5520125.1 hypothetical protein [Ectothiorhodospira sp. 9905]